MQTIILFNTHCGTGLVDKKIGLLRILWHAIILEHFVMAEFREECHSLLQNLRTTRSECPGLTDRIDKWIDKDGGKPTFLIPLISRTESAQ